MGLIAVVLFGYLIASAIAGLLGVSIWTVIIGFIVLMALSGDPAPQRPRCSTQTATPC